MPGNNETRLEAKYSHRECTEAITFLRQVLDNRTKLPVSRWGRTAGKSFQIEMYHPKLSAGRAGKIVVSKPDNSIFISVRDQNNAEHDRFTIDEAGNCLRLSTRGESFLSEAEVQQHLMQLCSQREKNTTSAKNSLR